MRESGAFRARWPGRCEICSEEYAVGDWLHYVGKSTVAHDYCHGRNYELPKGYDEHEPEITYKVKGRRNHEKRCATCFLIHAGECL